MKDKTSESGLARQALLIGGLWLVLALLLSLPRAQHPGYGVQGDLALHYHITRSYAESFSQGDPFPRWAGLLDGGRGDALFTFYPPLTYALSAVLIWLTGVGVLGSLKMVSVLMLITAQGGAWSLAREFYDRRRSLMVSSMYVLMPTYPLIALHRGFFANGMALALAPWALLGARRLLIGEKDRSGLAILAVSMSAIVLCHAITTYLTGLTIGLMALAFLKRAGVRGVMRLAWGGAVALCLTAFFLWPQVVERNWVQLGLQIVQQDFRNYFLFAGSPDGTRYRQAWASVNFVTSLVILTQTATGLLTGIIAFRTPPLFEDRERPAKRNLATFCLLACIFGLLISMPLSEPLWRYLPGLKFIQFPWRYQTFVSLSAGLLAAAAMNEWAGLRRWPRLIISALLTWLVIFNLAFTFMFVRPNADGLQGVRVSDLLSGAGAQAISNREGRRLQNEDDLKYVPYTSNQIYFRPPGSAFTLYPPAERPGGIEPIVGNGRFTIIINKIEHREYRLENETPVRLRIITHAYPHWVARIDGQEIPIEKEAGTGLMIIAAPAGEHRLTLDFEVREISERVARWVSMVSWLALAGWIVRRRLFRS